MSLIYHEKSDTSGNFAELRCAAAELLAVAADQVVGGRHGKGLPVQAAELLATRDQGQLVPDLGQRWGATVPFFSKFWCKKYHQKRLMNTVWGWAVEMRNRTRTKWLSLDLQKVENVWTSEWNSGKTREKKSVVETLRFATRSKFISEMQAQNKELENWQMAHQQIKWPIET